MPKQKQLFVTPTPELDYIIEQESDRRGLAKSAIVREILLEQFAEKLAEVKQLKRQGKLTEENGKLLYAQ